MVEEQVEIRTADGTMPTSVFHPTHGGPHPVVLYLMDAPGIRPALRSMAMRLASTGYYVMLPNLYYRLVVGELASDELMHRRQELMGSVDPTNVLGDAEALLAHAAGDPAASGGPAGAVGFCMSGGLAIAVARALPERVKAAASIHGAWLVRDTPDSPHLGLDALADDAELYLAWCADDPTAPEDDKKAVEDALAEAGVAHTLDFFEDAVHGFAPPGSARHNEAASELHWERVHALLSRLH